MERTLELPQDVEALTALVVAHRQWLAERDERIAQLEQHNRLLVKLVFGPRSEKRVPMPGDAALQGHLFLADLAAEAERLAAEHKVVATVEVPAHTRTSSRRRGEFPAHLPVVRTVCELTDADRVCACGGELKANWRRSARRSRANCSASRRRSCTRRRGRSTRPRPAARAW